MHIVYCDSLPLCLCLSYNGDLRVKILLEGPSYKIQEKTVQRGLLGMVKRRKGYKGGE